MIACCSVAGCSRLESQLSGFAWTGRGTACVMASKGEPKADFGAVGGNEREERKRQRAERIEKRFANESKEKGRSKVSPPRASPHARGPYDLTIQWPWLDCRGRRGWGIRSAVASASSRSRTVSRTWTRRSCGASRRSLPSEPRPTSERTAGASRSVRVSGSARRPPRGRAMFRQ
jgi:hypothetical protein